MISIGEFALSTGLSVKALRFYDERGLLVPAEVDPHTGYRRYGAAQLRTAVVVRILRTAGMSVEDVKTALQEPDRLADLLQGHAAELERRRDLEDRAMRRAHGLLSGGGMLDDGPSASADAVRFRTAERAGWVAVVDRLHLDADELSDVAETMDAAERHLERLAQALRQAGVRVTGGFWAGLEQVPGSPAVVEQRLALPVDGELPDGFAVPGLRIASGVLPRREEAYVVMTMTDDEPDLLVDAPGGPLPPEEMIVLAEVLEERGLDRSEVRQRGLGRIGDAGDGVTEGEDVYAMEAAVTVRVLD